MSSVATPSKSSSAVVRYQRSATCNSLEGSHKRPMTKIAITSAHPTVSRLHTKSLSHCSSSFNARHKIQLNRHRAGWLTIIEQLPLRILMCTPRNTSRQRLSPCTPLCIQFSQLRHILLHYLATASDRTNQLPINMSLAVFAPSGVSQVHAQTVSRRANR